MRDSPLGDSAAVLSSFLLGERTLLETLEEVCALAVDSVGHADLAGLTLPVEGRQRTAVFTDPTAPEVDQAQYETGDGPCLEALRQQEVFAIDSTSAPGRWPAFRRSCLDHGILSTLSLPLAAADRSLGAMNLYSRSEGPFPESDRQTATQFATQASVVLANAQAYWEARDLTERLGEMMRSRAVIEQAKGMLMAAQHCDEDQAFDLLVRASQRENVKLRDIAQRLVDRAMGSEPPGEQILR